jgi:hypothetical protein
MMRIFDRIDSLAVVVVGATLTAVVTLGAERLSAGVFMFCLVVAASALVIGRAAFSFLPEGSMRVRLPAEVVVGITGLSTFTWSGYTLFGVSAGATFLASCGLAVGTLAYCAVTKQSWQRWSRTDLVALTVICCVSVTWCWVAIQAVPTLRATGRLPVWADYNLQAIVVAAFARPKLSLLAVPFYHSASLMVPAALNGLTQLPALICVTALWTPLGFVVMGLGAYALGTEIGGRSGGIAAAAALLLVPNTAHYLQNGMFDFHWLVEISTGASYAIGLCLVALALWLVALRHQSARAFWLALVLSLVVLPLRSQIFLPFAITQFILLIVWWRPSSRLPYIAGIATATLVLVCGVLIAESLPRAPHLFTDWPPDPIQYVRFAFEQGPPIQARVFESFFASLPFYIPVIAGIIYLLLISSGAMFVAGIIGFFWCGKRQLLLKERWFPIAAISAFILIIVIVPPSPTTQVEMHHTQFPFLYAVLAVWVGCFVGEWARITLGRYAMFTVGTMATFLLSVPLLLSPSAQVPAGASLAWTKPYVGLMLPPGMMEAATFLREHSTPHDWVMATSNYQCGPLAALLERPTWFPEVCEPRSVTPASTTPTRPVPANSVEARVLSATNCVELMKAAHERRVAWILMYATNPAPAWLIECSFWHNQTFFVVRVDSDDRK